MKLFYIFIAIFILSPFAFGTTQDSPIHLEHILKLAWQNSPLLVGQRIQHELASGDRYRRFIFNEPQLQYSNSDDNTARTFGLSLALPFPGKSFVLTRLDTAKANLQRAELFAKKYDITKTITQAYLDCSAAQATYEIQKLTSADLETVSKTLKSLYETGHSTQAEKIGSELQSRQSQFDLSNAEDKPLVFCKRLDDLLSAATATEKLTSFVNVKTTLPDDLDSTIISELGEWTADQSRADANIALARATANTAWWSQAPDLNFSLSRNQYIYLPGSPSGKEWTTTYGITIVLPIIFPFHESVEARRMKSQAQMDQNSAETQKIAADSDQLIAAKEYIRSRTRLKELRLKDLALAEALVESTYSAYRSGKLGYAELVLSRKTLSDIRNQDIQLRLSIINAHLRCLNHCEQADTKTQTDENIL